MKLAVVVFSTALPVPDLSAQCTGCLHASFGPAIRGYAADSVIDVVSADFDGDGFLDLVAAVGDGIGFMRGSGSGAFAAPVKYASSGSNSIVTADFNGDGMPDIGTAGAHLSIFLGNGDGTFEPPLEYTPDFAAYTSIAAADFNGDGTPDLAVAAFSPIGIWVYVGTGDGSFQPPSHFGSIGIVSIAAADFNLDGNTDIAAFGDGLYLYLGDGAGEFAEPLISSGTGGWMAVGDYNQDGVPDIASAQFYDVAILLGNGDGSFASGQSYFAGYGPNYIATGDLNRDSVADLAVSTHQDGDLVVLRGRGDGTFEAPIIVPAGSELGPLLARDFDGNGWVDISVVSAGLIEVALADASGSFSRAAAYPTGLISYAEHPPPLITLADFTGDGAADIAVGNSDTLSIAILPGNGSGQFGSPIAVPVSSAPRALIAGLFNGDALPDLAIGSDSGLQILLSNGDETYQTFAPFGTPSLSITTGDFNSDGRLDLVSLGGFPGLIVYLGNGDGTFSLAPFIPGEPSGDEAVAADLNGDGKADLIVSSAVRVAVLIGNGNGTFVPGASYSVETPGLTHLAAADFDGDGTSDVVVTYLTGDVNPDADLYWGNGDGTLEPPVQLRGGTLSAIAGDVNGDDLPDIILGERADIRIYMSRGDRSFELSDWVRPNVGGLITAGDVNGDQKLDLASVGGFPPMAAVILNTICVPSRVAVAVQPRSCASSVPFAPQPVLHVLDDGGNVMTCSDGPASATLVPDAGTPGALLDGAATVSVVGGVATFASLLIDRAGRGYVLEFSYSAGKARSRTLSQDLGVALGGPATFCSGTTASYRTISGGYDRYHWMIDGIPISRAPSVTLENAAPGPHLLEVLVYQDGCSASDAMSINIEAPPASVIAVPLAARVGETGLVATTTYRVGSTYQWSLLGGMITAGQGTSEITFDAGPPGTTMVLRVSETSASGCLGPEASALVQVDFTDVPVDSPFRDAIDTMARHGITSGCGAGVFCPDALVTRAQIAVFLLRAEHGAEFVPPPTIGIFPDVPPGSFAADWIERLYLEGITVGCGGGQFCPSLPVSRAQMAVLLLKTEHGFGYSPPVCAGLFHDVPCSPTRAFAVDWIEQLFNEGITAGCGEDPALYCPGIPVTRAQMAVFLVKAFELP